MADDDNDIVNEDEDEDIVCENEVVSEEGQFDVKSHEVLPKMYLAYALSAIKDRSLPDIRDGLKPVARRILFGMHEMSLTHSKPTRKSARVVGEVMGKYHPHGDGCWRGSANVLELNGKIHRLKDLVGKQIWVLAHDTENNKPVPAIAHSFRITKFVDELYRVTFWNGEKIELTDNHELEKLSGEWSRTDALNVGDIITNGIITNNEYPKFRSSNERMSIGKKLHHIVGEHIHGEAEIYHHKDENTKNNLPDNIEPVTKIAHEKLHKNYEKGLRKGNETMFHGIDEFREATRKKNSEIIKAVNQKHYLFKAIKILKMMIEDDVELTEEVYNNYRVKVYNGTTLERLKINGHTFDEVAGYAKSKEKLRLIDTSLAKGHIESLKVEENNADEHVSRQSNDSRKKGHLLYTSSIVVSACLENYGLNFNIKDYDDIRCDLCETDDNNFYPKFETLTKWFGITTINQLLDLMSQRNLMIIKKIETFNVDHEPVYDFTVDKYENMYMPVGTNERNETKLIVAHNSIYGAAVRLAQPFTTRYPLIIGQGNFGSVEDKPAAMRYTEMKMSAISDMVVADIDKATVDFMPNFDGTLNEPKVLPTRLPLFLLNGSVGIAVGMATSAPPHNLTEIIDAMLTFIDNEDVSISELMQYLKGPDFPSGAYMFDNGIRQIYETGRGSVTIRAKAEIVDNGKRQNIIITELPYQLDKSKLITRIADLYKKKEKIEGIDGISDIRDESDKHGTRLVVELRRGVRAKAVLNTLFRRTELQTKQSFLMRALIDNVPKLVTLKEIFGHFVNHRKDVITRRTEFELNQAEKKAHILRGYLVVFDNLDAILEDVKTSKSTEMTYKRLQKYKLSDEQIKAILDLRVQRLAQFEREAIVTEHSELMTKIHGLKQLLDSEVLVLEKIKEELAEIRQQFGDARKTKIIKTRSRSNSDDDDDNKEESLDTSDETIDEIEEIQEEDVVVTVTHNGLVKRTPVSEYRVQNVRGKGLIGVDVKEEDYVEKVFQLSTHDYTLVFTNKGHCYKMNVFEIPSLGRTAAGSSILNVLNLNEDEIVASVVPITNLQDKMFLMVTRKGQVKKLKAEKLQRPRAKGTKVVGLDDNDVLIDVKLIDQPHLDALLVTRKGISIRFPESAVRASGKSGSGVRAIKLADDDCIVSVNMISEADNECFVMLVTERGYSKKTILRKFRTQRRGGRGIICMDANTTVGKIVSAGIVLDEKEQFIVMTSQGMLIRLKSAQIRTLGRNTQGSRIQKLKMTDSVAAVAYLGIVEENESDSEQSEVEDE